MNDNLSDLLAMLSRAERELACAEYIDNTERRNKEVRFWQSRIALLKAHIARLDDEREAA